MRARDTTESHRVSTPLELLFDLTFVAAISLLAAQFGHSIAAGHWAAGLEGYLTVFFAIWWAWMNYTWFASAFDTDDVPYRLLTMLQMGGVLLLAAGVPAAFNDSNFKIVTLGYAIMRVAMIAQWLRAAASDPPFRTTALRFAGAIAAVQVGWGLRLLLPHSLGLTSFVVLVIAEVSVPMWAERANPTTWHPHHIAERYGLFTIIVLGECVLAATAAMQTSLTDDGSRTDLVLLGGGSLVLLFGLWWLYFLHAPGSRLEIDRKRGFLWGYGHYAIFGALAALGAGLEVAAETLAHHVEASDTVVAYSVAIPIAVYLALLWTVHAGILHEVRLRAWRVGVAIVAVLALGAASGPLSLPGAVAAMCLPIAGLVGGAIGRNES
jgi:low temperature requirement protein LtrA